jgi:O-antigen/teichoic acid export membrane protein
VSASKAGGWVIIGFVFNIVIRFSSNLIMTRLLAPDAFGIVAISNIVILGLQLLSDVGLKQSVIRKESVDNRYLDSIWVVQILKGFLVAFVVCLTSLFVYLTNSSLSGVYSDPVLPVVLLLAALNPVVMGFETTKQAMANRNLSLGLITSIEIFSQLLGFFLAISLAFNGWGIWALVSGPIFASFVRVVSGYFLLPGYNNNFRINKDDLKDIFGFGKWMVIASLVAFLASYADQIIFAAFVSSEYMGFLAIALFILGVFRSFVSKLSNDVLFPKMSGAYRKSKGQLVKTYYQYRLYTDAYLFLVAGGLYASSDVLIALLYDDRYFESGKLLSILSLSLVFERYILVSPFYWSMGISKIPAMLQASKVVALLFGLPLVISLYGVEVGVAYIAFYRAIEIPFVFYFKVRDGFMSIYKEIFPIVFLPIGYILGLIFNQIILGF